MAGDDIIDLSRDYVTEVSHSITDGALRAAHPAAVPHTDSAGIIDLRAAAARHLSLLSGGRPVNADHVLITSGARQSLFAACFTLFESGDCVLIPTPSSPLYPSLARLARAIPILIPGDLEWSLKVGTLDLDRSRDARTAGLILSTPVDPTGAVYTRSELRSILEWAHDRNVWVIVDESHRHFHFGSGPAPSVLDLPDELVERTVVVVGLEQAYCMTGWRVGIVFAPSAVARAMARVQEHVTDGVSVPVQYAAAAMLADDRCEGEIDRMTEFLRQRRDQVVRYFRESLSGVEFVEPLGAPFCFFRVDGVFGGEFTGAGAFCERLLAEKGVAVAPGETFGDGRWVRLTYGVPARALGDALERIAMFMNALAEREDV